MLFRSKGKGKKDGKGKGNCFQCGELGHWKRNYLDFLATKVQSMIESQVVEVIFITDTSNTWCIDSGATNHICNTLQGFRSTRQCHDGEIKLTLASNVTISVVAIGVVVLKFQNNRTLVLPDVLYVPNSRRNLILVSN